MALGLGLMVLTGTARLGDVDPAREESLVKWALSSALTGRQPGT